MNSFDIYTYIIKGKKKSKNTRKILIFLLLSVKIPEGILTDALSFIPLWEELR